MARTDNQPEKSPSAGGSYVRHPVTGDLNPNLDDHVMAARDAKAKSAAPSPAAASIPGAPAAPAPAAPATKGGDQ